MNRKPTLETVLPVLREMLPDLRARYRVEEIAVFGSITRPSENPAGDIDLLVSFSEPPGLLRFVELENLLSDRLGSPVDLVLRDALKPRIGARILQSLVPV